MTNPDVAAAGVDSFAHYLQFGWREGRDPSAFFDTNFYLSNNVDVRAAGIEPLQHHSLYGWRESRDPGPGFDTSHYLLLYPDVKAAGLNPLFRYLSYGAAEGRAPNGAVLSAWKPGSAGLADQDVLADLAYLPPSRAGWAVSDFAFV
jgi:hypothetical protein